MRVPDKPSDDQHAFGYNTVPTEPFHWYFPQKPFDYSLPKAEVDAVNAGKAVVFAWGDAAFRDNAGKHYRQCYAALIEPPSAVSPSGSVREVQAESYSC